MTPEMTLRETQHTYTNTTYFPVHVDYKQPSNLNDFVLVKKKNLIKNL